MKRQSRIRCLPLLIAAALLPPAVTQVDRSSIAGTVTDANGGRVPGAKVTAIQSATGLERTTETSPQGTYMIDSLPIGQYTVTVRKTGFVQVRFENVDQGIGEARVLNAQLQVAGIDQTVTVSEPLVRLEPATATVGAPVEQAALEELPLNGRNWTALSVLAPGAIDNGACDQRTIRFAGHGMGDNDYLFDAIDATGIYNQEQKEYVRLAIPLDSIAQFQVQSQNFSADVGMTPGGQVSVASASGANNFHGGLFEYYRSDVFDARAPWDGASPNSFLLNQFGGSLSGPIVSNRTFFFANYEGLRQHLAQVQIGLVPSPSFDTQVEAQSPALALILAAYPQGTSPTSNSQVWNYVAGANQVDNEDSGMLRLDHHFTDRSTAFLRYSADEAVYSIPTGVLTARSNTDSKLKNGVVEFLHVFSTSLVNEAKFGINQVTTHTANVSGTPWSVSVSNLSALTGTSTTDQHNTSFNYLDDLTWSKGRHVLKFGVEIKPIQMNVGNSASGSLTYTSLNNFLGNVMDSASYTSTLPLQRLRKVEAFAYANDQIKLTPNLTVNLGVRYIFFNVFHEIKMQAIPFDLATCGGYCAAGSPFNFPRHADFDPRVGIAWSHGKTVLRTGVGIYHGDGEEDDQDWPISNSILAYSLSSVTSKGLSYPIGSFLANTTGTISPRDLYRDRKDMYVAAWTASIQRSLPGNIVGTASYMGNKGTNVLTTSYVNTVNPLTGVQPYPQYGVISWRGNDSNSNFNAVQLNARRAFQKGFLLSTNYMWSHSINDDGIGGAESDKPQNVFCRACQRASSDDDVRQVFNASAIYELPFGVGKRALAKPGAARAILGGWQLSGIATARTGLPVNVVITRSNSSVPQQYAVSSVERPNLVPGVSLIPPGGQTPNDWINAAAFSTPANGTYGNAGRNLVRAPELWQMDMALAKKIGLTERVHAEFRAEAFNLFNRAQFGAPSTNLSSPLSFGVITTLVNQTATGSGTPRQLQLALRISF
ncbi:MAG TPA: TonB-dependent receptor [Bryobacteraceae bacterium]|nr:TonB-dependent receptor [Bryobacteraceae bacterium]